MDFKIKKTITKEWLWEQELGCSTNAERVVNLGDLSVIPEELYGEFLTVCQKNGHTVFHGLCSAEGSIKGIPAKYFTRENLLMQDEERLTPLSWATEFGLLDYIPFERLDAEEWIPYSEFLRKLWSSPRKTWKGPSKEMLEKKERRAESGRNKLHRFIREVEVSTTLKEKTPIRVDQ